MNEHRKKVKAKPKKLPLGTFSLAFSTFLSSFLLDTHSNWIFLPFQDTTNAETSLWLVKIPSYIAERWADKKPNEMLGRMNVALVNDPTGRGVLTC